MAGERSRVADYAVSLVVRVAVCIIQALSWPWALALARCLGWLAWRLDRRHRLIATDNVRHAFPDLDESGVDWLVRASYLHLTTMLVAMIRLPRPIPPHNISDYIQPPHPRALGAVRAWVATGRPTLGLT